MTDRDGGRSVVWTEDNATSEKLSLTTIAALQCVRVRGWFLVFRVVRRLLQPEQRVEQELATPNARLASYNFCVRGIPQGMHVSGTFHICDKDVGE